MQKQNMHTPNILNVSNLPTHLQTTGRIFNIQRYSIHDGGGIRTIVFFKGCLLRCRWCCNPESQNYEIEKMVYPKEEFKEEIKEEIVGKDITVAEVITMVERDRAYYRRSGGGLTLSGGEALVQADFARDLLQAAKEIGIHTAMESTALIKYQEIEKILPYLDEFLMDIKHTNPVKHESFTGKQNGLALENAKKIAISGIPRLVIRIPVIPGFNATLEEITDIARFTKTLPGVTEIHLLPYHRFGDNKYLALDREYAMGDTSPPDATTMEELKAAVTKMNLHCQIGG